jgi:DMSO/TMAO reductase YedYZ molybdopterin-dependent catalytic subunit
MRRGICWIALAAALVDAPAGHCEPGPAAAAPLLEVVNESGKAFSFSAADLAELPQKELKAKEHSGDEATYKGVLVASVLKEADVILGERLRGKMLTNHLLVEASDKYRALFSLPEVDPDWTDHVVLLATSRNGEPLDAAHGPLQLVVPGDKRHSRWVKQVVRLTVRSDSK